MLSWDTAVEFGRALEALRNHGDRIASQETRLAAVEAGQGDIRREISTLRTYMVRGAVLALLWAAAIGGNLTAETAGELAGTTLKNLIKK